MSDEQSAAMEHARGIAVIGGQREMPKGDRAPMTAEECLDCYERAEYPTAQRPPIERYLRCTVTFGCWTVEPGLQYERGDQLAPLLLQLQSVICEAWKAAAPTSIDDVPKFNDAVEQLVIRLWPGRAWFLEVHHAIAGWTQIYQPYGIPRSW